MLNMKRNIGSYLPKGISIVELLQNKFCIDNNIQHCTLIFDIIDKQLRKLIEVKVIFNFERARIMY